MGLFSSRSRSSNSVTNETDNFNTSFGIGGDNNGLAVSGDGNQFLDGGAISAAIDLALNTNAGNNRTTQNALFYGAGSQNAAYDFLDGFVENSNENTANNQADVFEYVAGAQQESNKNNLASLDFASSQTENVLSFGAGVTQAAFGAIAGSANDTLEYSAGLTDTFITASAQNSQDSMEYSSGLTMALLDSNQENTNDAFQFGAGLTQSVLEASENSANKVFDGATDTLSWGAGLVNSVLGTNDANNERQYELNMANLSNLDEQRASVDNMLDDGYMFAGGLIQEILGSSEANQQSLRDSHQAQTVAAQKAADANQKALAAANTQSLNFAGQSLTAVTNSADKNRSALIASNTQSLNFAGQAVNTVVAQSDKALNFVGETAKSMLNGISEFTMQATGQISKQNESGLETIASLSTASDAKSREDMLKLAGGFGVLLTAGFAYLQWKK